MARCPHAFLTTRGGRRGVQSAGSCARGRLSAVSVDRVLKQFDSRDQGRRESVDLCRTGAGRLEGSTYLRVGGAATRGTITNVHARAGLTTAARHRGHDKTRGGRRPARE